MSEEMKSVLLQRSSSLAHSKELLDESTSEDTRVLKMQCYEGLPAMYDHLDGFIYVVEGQGKNDDTKCRLFLTTLKPSPTLRLKTKIFNSENLGFNP
ncbi:hypothetical protein D8674_037455 [Pyrus ussuriensis x Pyrus communis]|uniref:Uncharacterized protein n=1 Tax=Pyrus ussuriensis x Pyrus communis TaxID=2448454 RepID=A0A5N5GW97_9ROSA|nr:hypothetical protein D8674_037455 [Pyrus ussuriensis x Pyrus communis]